MADFSTEARFWGDLHILFVTSLVHDVKDFCDFDILFLGIDDSVLLIFWKISYPASKILMSVTKIIKDKLSCSFFLSSVKSILNHFENSIFPSFLLAFVDFNFLHDQFSFNSLVKSSDNSVFLSSHVSDSMFPFFKRTFCILLVFTIIFILKWIQ